MEALDPTLTQLWADHGGHGVGYHSGWAPWLRRMRILLSQKEVRNKKLPAPEKWLKLGVSQRLYAFGPLSYSEEPLRGLLLASVPLDLVLQGAIRNARDWLSSLHVLDHAFIKCEVSQN